MTGRFSLIGRACKTAGVAMRPLLVGSAEFDTNSKPRLAQRER